METGFCCWEQIAKMSHTCPCCDLVFLEYIEAKSIKELCKLCGRCCVEQPGQRFSLFNKKRARPGCFIYNYRLYIEWRNEWLNRAKCRPQVEWKMRFHNTSEITGLCKWWHKTLMDECNCNLFRVVKCTVLANTTTHHISIPTKVCGCMLVGQDGLQTRDH